LEYLEWCEDMQMEPVLAVYAGYALGDVRDAREDQMPAVLQEALDMLEYCMGPTSTRHGALRAQHGHAKPVQIKFVEIGNEDWFSATYDYRWKVMYEGMKKRYPNITYISTVYDERRASKTDSETKARPMQLPPGTMWDTHHYEEPKYFLKNFNFYDNWQEREGQPGVGVLLGEYSVYEKDTLRGSIDWNQKDNEGHMQYPQLLSALAEGVYALGGERNPNTVWMSSYAPSLMRLESSSWTPNMLYFTTDQTKTVRSPSYWQQWMFGQWRGTHTLAVEARGAFNPLFWVASADEGRVYLKVINVGNETVPLTVSVGAEYVRANATILTSESANDANDFTTRGRVTPKQIPMSVEKSRMQWDVPRWSITVVQFGQ
jgi:alpha-N-arabinofuranosidase